MIAVSQPYSTQQEAAQAAAELEGKPLIVASKQVEIVEEAPPQPYTTASLLEDATTRLKFSSDEIMCLAQRLFEGVELYGAPTGLITYHRTDSVSVDPEAKAEAREVITRLFGKQALPLHPPKDENHQRSAIGDQRSGNRWSVQIYRLFKRSDTNRQSKIYNPQSHEAIRPTSPMRLPEGLAKVLDEQTLALYRLIWERFIASQMKPARYRFTTVELEPA